ncbi:GerAB/ArcD/ProY family transporter [Cohnella fermenti]|uniref:Spore gernimation protein n=1 Tax=Cohnella fermenti TaxID=2565925 RepID=A0A4S4BRC2_9BACL|nr:endospore germination permease [Cohnella fermenti]THF77546.1 spore gernimation protein [Cohnella fermenti]
MKKLNITNGMLVAMIVNMIYVKAIGVTQGVLARQIGQDMWIATLLGTLQGIGILYITHLAMRRTPDLDMIALGDRLLGKGFGTVVALLIFLFFLAAIGPVMITFVYHLQDYFLPEAPLSLFIVCALLVGALGCFYGLEVIARLALIGCAFIFLLNVLIVIGSFEEFDIRNLLPVLEQGLPRTLAASLHFDVDCALASMMAALVLPMLKSPQKEGGKVGMLGIATSGLMVIIWSILEGAVLSAEVTSRYTISCMKLARNAHIGEFLQRYEMIMIALYSISALFQVMFCLYGVSVCTARILRLKSIRPVILPCCLMLGTLGYWIVKDHFRAIVYLERYWPWVALPIGFGLPLVMLGLRLLMGRRLKGEAAAQR